MATLTGKQLKDSYQSLVTIKDADDANPTSGQLENGLGNPITALGIGIDSGLTYPLTIKEDTNNSYIHFVNSTTGSAFSDGSQIGVPSGSSDFLINNRESANIRILTSGDEKMRIEADGDIAFYDDANNQGLFWDASTARLGLGTTSPDASLHVESSDSTVAHFIRPSSGPSVRIGSSTTDNAVIGYTVSGDYARFGHDSATNAIVVDSSGNVGINTTGPTSLGGGAKLTVNQAVDGNIVFARGGSTRQVQLGTTSTTGYINADNTSGGLTFNVNALEKARIDSSGNLQARRTRSNTVGDVALSLQPTDSTIHYGFRIDSANNFLNIDRVDSPLNLISITGAGNVGIGTASAEKRLHINDNTQANQAIRFGNPNATPYGEINYDSSGSEHLYIRAKGTTRS
jgi:hypothetical protein